jgi:hypothetical protein
MVRNIIIIDPSPLVRLEKIMKFVGGSSFVVFRDNIIRQHCTGHEVFNKNCLICQRLSSNQIDIKEEKTAIARIKHLVGQSNSLYEIYKRAQNLDVLDSIIRKSFGIVLDKPTRTLEKLRNIIRLKKSGVQRTALSKEETECLDHLWTTPHVFIVLGDLVTINKLMDNMDILDIVNSVDNPFIHIFYEIEDQSQIPEMLIEYELDGLMTILKD